MAPNQVSLVLDLYDGSGIPVTQGKVVLTPNYVVRDASDHIVVTRVPITVNLRNNPLPTVSLVANDDSGLSPAGWGWVIDPQFPGAPAKDLYLVNYANGATQYLSELLPAGSAPALWTQIPVSGTPSAGDVITATSPTTADWETPGALTGFAPLASPAFTGTPTAPTKSPLTNSTALATTAYADAAVLAAAPWLDAQELGCNPNGAADCSAIIQNALNTLAAGTGGVIFFRPGVYLCNSPLAYTGATYRNVTLLGPMSSMTGGATTGAMLKYTGAGATSFIAALSNAGFTIQGLQVFVSNAAFTGRIIDFRNVSASDTSFSKVSRCTIGSIGATGALYGVDLDKANTCVVEETAFFGVTWGVNGRASAASYSNANTVRACHFLGCGSGGIHNPGQGWTIDSGCTFESIAGGGAGGIICDTGVGTLGTEVTGNWFGDITAGAGGSQISLAGGSAGVSITGNYIGFNTGATGIIVGNGSTGLKINGNRFDAVAGVTAISLGTGCSAYDFSGNSVAQAMTFPSPLADALSVGTVTLGQDPTAPLQAATMQYAQLQSDLLPQDCGLIAWTFNPRYVIQENVLTALGAAGSLWFTKIILREAASVTNIVLAIGNAVGSAATSGQCFAGLYNSSGTLIGATPDQSTVWTTAGNANKSLAMPLASGPFACPAGQYWVVLLFNGTTGPTVCQSTGGNSSAINFGLTAATANAGFISGAHTSLPSSITPSSIGIGHGASLNILSGLS